MDIATIVGATLSAVSLWYCIRFYRRARWFYILVGGMRLGEWMSFEEVLALGVPQRYTLAILAALHHRRKLSIRIRPGLISTILDTVEKSGFFGDEPLERDIASEFISGNGWAVFPSEFEYMLHEKPRRRFRRKRAEAPKHKELVPVPI